MWKNKMAYVSRIMLTTLMVSTCWAVIPGHGYAQSSGDSTTGTPVPKQKPVAKSKAVSTPVAETRSAATPNALQGEAGADTDGPSSTTVATTKFNSWAVVCETQTGAHPSHHCSARSSIVNGQNQQQLLLVLDVRKNQSGQWALSVQTPSSVVLKPGIKMTLGTNEPKQLEFVSCQPALCSSEVSFDQKLLDELTATDKAVVTYVSLVQGETKVDFGLKGANSAISYLLKQ